MNFSVEDDSRYYEMAGLVRRFFNVVLIYPFLNNFHRLGGKYFLKSSSRKAAEVHTLATTFKALEVLYTFDHKMHFIYGFWDGIFTFLWQHVMNVKAVRNRLQLVEKKLHQIIQESSKATNGREITILSIGAGSARAVIDVAGVYARDGQQRIKVIAVDKNPDAAKYSLNLAKQFSIVNSFQAITASLGDEDRYLKAPPDIVEMVGLLDYFDDDQAVKVMKRVYNFLKPGGIFITANVNNNPERPFVTHTAGWELIYRTPSQLCVLSERAGFDIEHSEFIQEPLGIHTVAILRK